MRAPTDCQDLYKLKEAADSKAAEALARVEGQKQRQELLIDVWCDEIVNSMHTHAHTARGEEGDASIDYLIERMATP
jgi:hypothetical protein